MPSPTPAINGTKRGQRRTSRGHLVLVPSLPEPAPAPASSSHAEAPAGVPCAAERPAFARHLLTAIRVAMGLAFVVCGLNGFFDFLPRPAAHDGAFALGHTLLVAGSMLPLLKGSEVLLETLLDLYQELRSRASGSGRQFSPRSE